MHKDELRQLLTDFAAERLAILQRHEAAARAVSHYDFNNTYQYVIAREETHVAWVQNALAEFGVVLPGPAAALPAPEAP
jgi:Mn-containing catalase